MVAVKGLGGIPEPQPERLAKLREGKTRDVAKAERTKDDVLISSEAQAAASVARTIQVAKDESEIRADRVAAARENMERGDYRKPEVVAKVAERISKYLP
jgi:hypothetical protein